MPNLIEPFYFGPSGRSLFGCYHIPHATSIRDCGIICCYSIGYEYIRFHRAFRQLADRLAKVGFPVLRFDFYGCGDSGGEREQGNIEQWRNDLVIAIDEIKRRAKVENICLVGLRLGGALSMMIGAERGDIDGMVLWDPVVRGKTYLHELTALHKAMLEYAHVQSTRCPGEDLPTEILGFPFIESMLTDFDSLDLSGIRQTPAKNIFIIESDEKVSQIQLRDHLRSMNIHVDHTYQHNPQLWIWEGSFKVIVPHQILQLIVSWISEVYP